MRFHAVKTEQGLIDTDTILYSSLGGSLVDLWKVMVDDFIFRN